VPLAAGDTEWLPCDGRSVLRNQYPRLFATVGITFGIGANPLTTFALPDLRGRAPFGVDGPAGTLQATLAQTGGTPTVNIQLNQLPIHTHAVALNTAVSGGHTHPVTDPGHSHPVPIGIGALVCQPATFERAAPAATIPSHATTTGITLQVAGEHSHTVTGNTEPTGNGANLAVVNPYIAVPYVIKT